MAESNFDRFRKMYPKKSDIPMLANPAPMPGPGGVVRGVVKKGIESGVRRFGNVDKGNKVTQQKGRDGLMRDTVRKKEATSGTKTDRMGGVRENRGPTKMKDRKGLERKVEVKPETKTFGTRSSGPKNRGDAKKVAGAGLAGAAIVGGYYGSKALRDARSGVGNDRKTQTNQQVRDSSYNQTNPTQRPYDASTSPKPKADAPRPKARPADLKKPKKAAPKREKKSKTRIAFEKEFAAARKAGKKEFTFKGGKYKSYNTKLAK
jgi:hypothetical protein